MQDLALRLLAVEAASQSAPHGHVVVRVCEKLRVPLTRLAGIEGFTSLMRRALALARAEVPSLHSVHVKADGSLEGLEELATDPSTGGAEVAFAITAQLLVLLDTLIGEPLTLRLVRAAWPNTSLDDQHRRIETNS